MFVSFPITTIDMKQPFLRSPQATPNSKPITFKRKTYTNTIIRSTQISMLEDKKRPWVGRETVQWNTCWKVLWKKLRGPMNDGKRRDFMQLRLVDWFLNWNSHNIAGFILISVSEYSTIPSAPLGAFRLGTYEQSSCSLEQTKQPARCLGYQSID